MKYLPLVICILMACLNLPAIVSDNDIARQIGLFAACFCLIAGLVSYALSQK